MTQPSTPKAVERHITECSHCGQELYKCSECGDYLRTGEHIQCDADNMQHRCRGCAKEETA